MLTMKNYALKFLGKEVTAKIDRPLGSKHPKHDYVYPVNYGFIPDTLAPDSHEIDVYVLGITKPLKKFTGICIAIIHRDDDDDDKVVLAPPNSSLTKEQIRAVTHFQEKYFKSTIILK